MEERQNNYLTAREQAKQIFLEKDQTEIIERWGLFADKDYIYVQFLNTNYKIDRTSGSLTHEIDGSQGGFEETLSVFDLLCHEHENGKRPTASAYFALTNSLIGRETEKGVATDYFTAPSARKFNKDQEAFKKACESCGGQPIPIGDIGYEFKVFADLRLRLRFYEADDEFPASIDALWNDNALEYAMYETTFYIMNALMDNLRDAFEEYHK